MPLNSVQALGYVILLCRDLKKMKEFYTQVLELKVNDESEDWVEVKLGPTLLSLRPRGRWYDGELVGDGASIQLSFPVAPNEVDLAHTKLVARDAEICEPPTDQDFGHRTLYFRDPEGNILEIYAEL